MAPAGSRGKGGVEGRGRGWASRWVGGGAEFAVWGLGWHALRRVLVRAQRVGDLEPGG